MIDTPEKRVLYIVLIGFGAIVPMAIGIHPVGAVLSLTSLFFVMLYIRSDRKLRAERPGFPVMPVGREAVVETEQE